MRIPKIIPSLNSIPFLPKACLGIDIGTSALKVIELSRWAGRRSLKNYGELKAITLYDKPFRTFDKNTLILSSKDIARALRAIRQESKISSTRAVFSIPDFSSLFTSFELPPMTKAELPGAVDFEARKHIPMPLSEVIFDWQILSGRVKQNTPLKILLVAVPREVVNQYQEIATLAKLELVALEAEAFGLIRSITGEGEESMLVLDIGAQSTTINTVVLGKLHSSRSFDIAGNAFSERIARSLSITAKEADAKKAASGIEDNDILEILTPLVDLIAAEIKKSAVSFPKDIKPAKVVLAGGTAFLPGLREYLGKSTNIATEYAFPFRSVFYPPILESTIKVMGPSYAVAVGAALRGIQ